MKVNFRPVKYRHSFKYRDESGKIKQKSKTFTRYLNPFHDKNSQELQVENHKEAIKWESDWRKIVGSL